MHRQSLVAVVCCLITGPVCADAYEDAERATEALNAGDSQLAIDLYTKAINQNSVLVNKAGIHANRGIAYKNLGKYESAVGDFSRAIAEDESLADVYGVRCLTLAENLRRYDEALPDCEKSLALDPNNAGAAYGLGYISEVKGNLEGAERQYLRSLELDPSQERTQLRLESVRMLKDRQRDFKLAVAAFEAGDFSKAIEIYTSLLGQPWMNAELYQLYYGRGLSYDRNGQVDAALKDFDWIIQRDQSMALVYSARCVTLTKLKRYPDALADCQHAETLDASLFDPPYVLGYIHEQMNDRAEAIGAYQRALTLNPNHEMSQQGLQRLGEL